MSKISGFTPAFMKCPNPEIWGWERLLKEPSVEIFKVIVSRLILKCLYNATA